MYLIVAFDLNQGIGINNALPWHIPEDLQHFKRLTLGCPVIMGRLTAESILKTLGKALPNRRNIVLSRAGFAAPDMEVYTSVQEVLDLKLENAWVIGGAQVYRLLLTHCSHLYITRINRSYECTQFFPDYSHQFTEITSPFPEGRDCRFEVWKKTK
jgi:dihydrofolate reductase